jgi:hypothetical protein
MAEITREELLARYAAGERNFIGLDLSEIVFGRCVLDGCNFRGATSVMLTFPIGLTLDLSEKEPDPLMDWDCILHLWRCLLCTVIFGTRFSSEPT